MILVRIFFGTFILVFSCMASLLCLPGIALGSGIGFIFSCGAMIFCVGIGLVGSVAIFTGWIDNKGGHR